MIRLSGSILIRFFSIFLLVFLGPFLVGCKGDELVVEPTPTKDVLLIPFETSTPSPEIDQDGLTKKATDIPATSPSPTPHIYEVVENDTLTGIANLHSVPLEEIIAANPGIDPNFLTIGLTLTIPIVGVPPELIPITTPIPLTIYLPKCYGLSNHSFQCFAVVENDTAIDVENVSAKISIKISDENMVSNTAYMPLDILPAGEKAAVLARFSYPLPPKITGEAELISVIPLNQTNQRYLQTDLRIAKIDYSQDGNTSTIMGSVSFPPEQPDVGEVWVSVFAYDAQDEIVGIRKWVADEITESTNDVDFRISVYSLGNPIETVDVLVEARPKQE
jgi:LysM repeat protein